MFKNVIHYKELTFFNVKYLPKYICMLIQLEAIISLYIYVYKSTVLNGLKCNSICELV